MWDHIINIYPNELLSTKTKDSRINESLKIKIKNKKCFIIYIYIYILNYCEAAFFFLRFIYSRFFGFCT